MTHDARRDNIGRLTISGDGERVVIAMIGEFDVSNADVVQNCLQSVLTDEHRTVIVDLSGTDFIDSTTVAAFVAAQLAGLSLTLRGAHGKVRKSLDIAGVDELMTVEPP